MIDPIRYFILLGCFALLSACASTPSSLKNTSKSVTDGIIRLDYAFILQDTCHPIPSDTSLMVITDEKIRHVAVAERLESILSQHRYTVTLYHQTQHHLLISPESLAYAKMHNIQDVVSFDILKWDERMTLLTGVPSQIILNLSIYNLKKQKIVASFTINAKTGILYYGEPIINLLDDPLNWIAKQIS